MIECMDLTGDGHVHTEWSYDTGGPHSDAAGRMHSMCRRAVQIGLPALAFTDHFDLTSWTITPEDQLPDTWGPLVDENGVLDPPPLDVEGYFDSVEQCRREFPDLHILTGVEFGQHFGFHPGRRPHDSWTRLTSDDCSFRVSGATPTAASDTRGYWPRAQ